MHALRCGSARRAAALLAIPHLHAVDEVLARHRSFFGVHTVLKDESGGFHVLMHGITVHGAQHLDPAKRLEPTAYYHRDGPLGQLFAALGAGGRFRQIALIGLGTGSAACYREAGREWTFFESIRGIELALAAWFTFLTECAPSPIIAGTAGSHYRPCRMAASISSSWTLSARTPSRAHDHERGGQLYFRKLSERGVLMLHITNQYLDLSPVLAPPRRSGPRGDGAGFRFPSRPTPFAQWNRTGWRSRATHRPRGLATGRVQTPGVGRGGRPWTDDIRNTASVK